MHPHLDPDRPPRHRRDRPADQPRRGTGKGGPDDGRGQAARRGRRGDPARPARNGGRRLPGHAVSQGILTARGGMTSHAAVVARGMGVPAVTGCSALGSTRRPERSGIGTTVIQAGDDLTIDGSTGQVLLGKAPMIAPHLGGHAATLLSWADDLRRLNIRANADTPADAQRARALGAEGVGLCRTEHMFFNDGRLHVVRTLILSESRHERARRWPSSSSSRQTTLPASSGPWTGCRSRSAPSTHPSMSSCRPGRTRSPGLAERLDMTPEAVAERIEELREANPMLGHRGCRLGMTVPEITEMQARAIFRAALRCAADGIDVRPEIMIPLVSDVEELRRQRRLIDGVAYELFDQAGRSVEYRIGTMIELPRAALRGADLAHEADFFSFGTNDLTQTALWHQSRRCRHIPAAIPDRRRVPARPVPDARYRRCRRAGPDRCRAWPVGQEPDSSWASVASTAAIRNRSVLPRCRARLRELLAVPGPGRTPGGCARRDGHRSSSHRLNRAFQLHRPGF